MEGFPKWIDPHQDHITQNLRKQGFDVFVDRVVPRRVLVTSPADEEYVKASPNHER